MPNLDPRSLNGGIKQIDPDGTNSTHGCAGGAGGTFHTFNFNPFNVFQTPFKRYNIYGQANYEMSDAVEVYARGLFSKNQVKTIIAPSGSFAAGVTINLNNPFLPATLRNQFCAFNVGADSTRIRVCRTTIRRASPRPSATLPRCAVDARTIRDYRDGSTIGPQPPYAGSRSAYQRLPHDHFRLSASACAVR